MIDCGNIRRNKLCWYKLDQVQSVAINDTVMIENAVYVLLKKYFSHLPCYPQLFELMHETFIMTAIGQSLDFQISKQTVAEYTMAKHRTIADHKTSHFAFYAPTAASLILTGKYNDQLSKQIKFIGYELGYFYQVQNDFMDAFEDPEVLKKPGTDIEESKCTWLTIMVLERGTEQQKDILKQNYGKTGECTVNFSLSNSRCHSCVCKLSQIQPALQE